jgi:CRISPR-associated endonuclease/helicase Cas3
MMNQRDFQKNTATTLQEGNSVLVLAPTGLGKTRAALDPFLSRSNSDATLNTRLIYTLPLRALSGGIASQFRELSDGIQPTIHHGDEPESEFFSERAIITTVDQYFTAFAGAPLAWASHLGHAAAGAVLTSYSVFDEVHLLSPRAGLQMLFAILRLRQRWGLRSCVMTATLPEPAIDFFREQCGLKVITATANDIRDRDSWRNVRILLDGQNQDTSPLTFRWNEKSPIELGEIVKEKWENWKELGIGGTRKIIVFLNTVERAIRVYEELSIKPICPNILLVHSRFTKQHRSEIENKIERFFGKYSSDKDEAILVTTQVAEAGLNISAPLLVTELCPVDSLIQRVGRCQRFTPTNSSKKEGLVMVVKPKVEDNKKNWYAPYFDSFLVRVKKGKQNKQAWIRIAEISRSCLEQTFGTGSDNLLNWTTESNLINRALSEAYESILSNVPLQLSAEELKKRYWAHLYYEVSKTKADQEDEDDQQEG